MLSLIDVSPTPFWTRVLVALQVSSFPLSNLVGVNINMDVVMLSVRLFCKIAFINTTANKPTNELTNAIANGTNVPI